MTAPSTSGPGPTTVLGARQERADDLELLRSQVPDDPGAEPTRMLPAVAYTSDAVLAWERRHLFAGSWTCLGRADELLGAPGPGSRPITQRAVAVGDVAGLLVADGTGGHRLFANTCRHRGHELLGEGETSDRRSVLCPYHAWTYDPSGALQAAPGFREVDGFDPGQFRLVELPLASWGGWLFGHGVAALGSPEVPDFATHLGDFARLLDPYRTDALALAGRHTYEVAANWKVVAENYHECYHCPLIHPELCQVSPPDSGVNYDLPGAFVGGSMDLRDGTASMTLTGAAAGPPLPGADPRTVEYLHLLPNLLVSAHPDYVMAHRLVPLAPGRTWIECSWYALTASWESGESGERTASVPAAVEFWDVTNQQDWTACESVQRGLASPHFLPGPFAPNEDAVAMFVRTLGRAYRTGRLTP